MVEPAFSNTTLIAVGGNHYVEIHLSYQSAHGSAGPHWASEGLFETELLRHARNWGGFVGVRPRE